MRVGQSFLVPPQEKTKLPVALLRTIIIPIMVTAASEIVVKAYLCLADDLAEEEDSDNFVAVVLVKEFLLIFVRFSSATPSPPTDAVVDAADIAPSDRFARALASFNSVSNKAFCGKIWFRICSPRVWT